jgi:uncharacterized protein (DUF2252 family)
MRLLLIIPVLCAAGCAPSVPAREVEVATVLARADEIMLHTRPGLVRGKYERMATDQYDFYRGGLPLFRHDWELGRASRSAFGEGLRPVWGLGDPHPENFGTLVARDGTAGVEPNDFDSADRVPYLFDLRRLTAGMALGARLADPSLDPVKIASETARAYASALQGYAQGAPAERLEVSLKDHDAIVADLFKRTSRDYNARTELSDFTVLDDAGTRSFRRGIIDPTQPTQTFEDLPDFARAAIAPVLTRLGSLTVIDAVREFGSGVAAWPRARVLVLATGAEGDFILEIKELGESGVAGWYAPVLAAEDTPQRVEGGARRAWSRPDADPHFFTTQWLGLPVLVRSELGGNKNVRVSRWVGARASQETLEAFGRILGGLLARVHSRSEPSTVSAIANRLTANLDAFAAEQGAFSDVYSAQVLDDQLALISSLARLGPSLGIETTPTDSPTPSAASVFGKSP